MFLLALNLVAYVATGHQGQQGSHAMVLDTYYPDQDMLVFKNTYDDESGGQPKRFKIKRTDHNAPEEMYFVHIEIKDMDNLPSREEGKADKQSLRFTEESAETSSKKSSLCSLCCCFSR